MRASTDPKPEPLPASALTVREALSDEELKAAAALRAKSFYVYPPEREFAGKVSFFFFFFFPSRHQNLFSLALSLSPASHSRNQKKQLKKMQIYQSIKAGEEFDALVARREAMELEAARAASERGGGGAESSLPRERAAALVALLPSSDLPSAADGQKEEEELLLPSSNMAVLGTLDLVAARSVEGEVLLGGGKAPAYLANVCVAPSGRRRGVGAALLARARVLAREWECDGLFVHALAVNAVAEMFYSRAGFVVDSEEGAASAARRGHCLDGVEGLGRSVLYRDATFLS